MTVHFMGSEIEDFPTRANVTVHTTSSNAKRTNMRGAVLLSPATEDTEYIETAAISVSDFWTHWVFSCSQGAGVQYICKWYSGGTQRLGIRWSSASGTIGIDKYTGTWANLGSNAFDPGLYAMTANVPVTFDVYIKLGNPGEVRVYYGNVIAIAVTGIDLSFISTVDKIRFGPASNSSWTTYCSEVLVTNWNTIGCRYFSRAPLGNGTYQEWTTGAFTVVDDLDATNADLATSGTANQRTTYTYGGTFAALSGDTIAAVKFAFSANRDAAGPQNINAMARISSTDYHDSDQALNITATKLSKMWETSPATSVAWTVAELNATEFGVRSRT